MNRVCIQSFVVVAALAAAACRSSGSDESSMSGGYRIDRTILPVAEPDYPRSKVGDVRNAKAPPRFELKAPQGAPNVLIVLIDDMGFGMPSAFGGPVRMPTAERLASQGIRYNQFHTAALCSPTRAALLSGRNHHSNNMACITEMATGFPGATGQRPDAVAPLAEMLRLNGFSTGFFGKNHETAAWEVSPSGPQDRWPTRSGFDKFYGFIGGETNQWAPMLYDGVTQVHPPTTPGYNFMTDMTDRAIGWMQYQKSLTPDRPFFMYFAPGATHAPHHVPKEWIAKNQGRFDQGWDKLREETLARQIQLGVVPAGTKLAGKPEAIQDWEKLTADEKRMFARQMEVYSAFGEYTDHEVGRLVDAIGEIGQLENTLVFYVIGDNGTSAEGGEVGVFNEYTYFNGVPEKLEDVLQHYDDWGGPTTYPHMAAGWAIAGDTPFMWAKQVASNFGGTRNGMIVSWPKRLKAKNEVRSQFHHVIDLAPTILEAAKLPEPKVVNGTKQAPIEGVSMLYTFESPTAPSRHVTQYFEIMGNRAIYHDGWFAGTVHRAPWELKPRRPLLEDEWELYDTRNDFSLANDLAAKDPKKLKAMQALFDEQAIKYRVFPIDDRGLERAVAAAVGRPDLMEGRSTLTLYPGMDGMSENVFINIKNRSLTITADVEMPSSGANGVLVCQGGAFGGWSLYVNEGKPTYCYNYLGMQRYTVAASEIAPAGRVRIELDFRYDGGGPGKGGLATLSIDGKKAGEGRVEHTQPAIFSADETADVGQDDATPVSNDYPARGNEFTGTIHKIVVAVQPVGVMSSASGDLQDAEAAELVARKAGSD